MRFWLVIFMSKLQFDGKTVSQLYLDNKGLYEEHFLTSNGDSVEISIRDDFANWHPEFFDESHVNSGCDVKIDISRDIGNVSSETYSYSEHFYSNIEDNICRLIDAIGVRWPEFAGVEMQSTGYANFDKIANSLYDDSRRSVTELEGLHSGFDAKAYAGVRDFLHIADERACIADAFCSEYDEFILDYRDLCKYYSQFASDLFGFDKNTVYAKVADERLSQFRSDYGSDAPLADALSDALLSDPDSPAGIVIDKYEDGFDSLVHRFVPIAGESRSEPVLLLGFDVDPVTNRAVPDTMVSIDLPESLANFDSVVVHGISDDSDADDVCSSLINGSYGNVMSMRDLHLICEASGNDFVYDRFARVFSGFDDQRAFETYTLNFGDIASGLNSPEFDAFCKNALVGDEPVPSTPSIEVLSDLREDDYSDGSTFGNNSDDFDF